MAESGVPGAARAGSTALVATLTAPHQEEAGNVRLIAWKVVAGTFLLQFVTVGAALYSFGAMVKPLASEFGAGRAEISAALLIYTITSAVLGPATGMLIATNRIRWVMTAGVAVTSLGFLLLSTATHLWQVYLYFGLVVGAGNMLMGILPCSAVVVAWFVENRGVALGLTFLGASIGGPVFVMLAALVEQAAGWRGIPLAFAIVTAAVLPVVIWTLIADPRRIGKDNAEAGERSKGFPWPLLADRRLWLAAGLLGFATAPAGAVIQTLHSHMTDLGFDGEFAALGVGALTIVAAFSKPLVGFLADRIGLRWIILAEILLQSAGLIVLAQALDPVLMFVGIVLAGLGYGGLAPLISLLLTSLFGELQFPKVLGVMTLLLLPFSLVGFPLAFLMQDLTGSYATAYLVFVGFLLLAAIALSQVTGLRNGSPDRLLKA